MILYTKEELIKEFQKIFSRGWIKVVKKNC